MARELSIRITADNSDAQSKLAATDRALDDVTASAKSANTAVAGAGATLRKAGDDADHAAKKTATVGTTFTKAGSAITGVVSGLAGGFMAGAVLGIVDSLGGLAKKTYDTANSVQDMADRLQVSTDAAQRWKFAIDQTGGSLPALMTSVQFLSNAIGEEKKGFVGALEAAGLKLADLKAMSPEQAFNTVAAAVQAIEDPLQRVTVGTDLLGRGFQKNAGAIEQGFAALGKQAEETGAIMSGPAVAAADEFGDSISALGDAGLALLGNVLTPILPILTDLIGIIAALVKPLGDLLGLILTPIGYVLGVISEGLKFVIGYFTDLSQPVADASSVLGEFWGWLANKLEPILGPIIGLISDVADMFVQFGKLVFAVHVEVIKAVVEMATKVIFWIADKLAPIFAPFKPILDGLIRAFTFAKDTIIAVVKVLYEGIKTYLVDKFTSIVDGAREKIQAVTGFFKDMYDKVVGHSYVPDMITRIGEEFGKLPAKMVDPAAEATGKTKGAFAGMGESVSDIAGGITRTLGNAFGDLLTGAGSFAGVFASIFDSLKNSVMKTVGDMVTGVLSRLVGAMTGVSTWGSVIGGLFGGGGGGAAGGAAAGAGSAGAGAAGAGAAGAIGVVGAGLAFAGLAATPLLLGRLINPGPMTTPAQTDLERAQELFNYGGPTAQYWLDFMAEHPELWGRGDGFKQGTFGQYGNFGMGTPTWLHGREAVVPQGYTPELASDIASAMPSQAVVVNIDARGALFPDRASMSRFADMVQRALPSAIARAVPV